LPQKQVSIGSEKPIDLFEQCAADIENCWPITLCELATYRSVSYQNGNLVEGNEWVKGNKNKKFVDEAKRRGLSCDLESDSNKLAIGKLPKIELERLKETERRNQSSIQSLKKKQEKLIAEVSRLEIQEEMRGDEQEYRASEVRRKEEAARIAKSKKEEQVTKQKRLEVRQVFKEKKKKLTFIEKRLAKIKIAAEQGDPDAQYELGYLLHHGSFLYEISRNRKISMKWFRRAAEGGNAKAQYKMAKIYTRRYHESKLQGASADYKAAKKWYRLAIKGGAYGAKTDNRRLQTKRVQTEVDKIQMKRAKALAKQYPAPPQNFWNRNQYQWPNK
jgi:hypothetical protein